MAGGPMMNIFLAVFLLGIVIMGFGLRAPTMTVDQVSDCVIPASEGERACKDADQVAPANEAGFKSGDEIVSFNGAARRGLGRVHRRPSAPTAPTPRRSSSSATATR